VAQLLWKLTRLGEGAYLVHFAPQALCAPDPCAGVLHGRQNRASPVDAMHTSSARAPG
jgi:hypothetical protein